MFAMERIALPKSHAFCFVAACVRVLFVMGNLLVRIAMFLCNASVLFS